MDVRDAMLDGAPILDETRRTAEPDGSTGDEPTNVAQHIRYEKGDVEAGFAAADIVIEREYGTTMAHQGYIEPHNSTAYWNKDDEVTIWTSTQGLFAVRDSVAGMLQLPVKSVKVEPVEIGGGFGGKIPDYLSPPAALLSRKTGKPVQLTMSRKEGPRGHRPHVGHVPARQDRRKGRRHVHRAASLDGLRGRGLPGLAHGRGHDVRLRALRLREPADRRLRRGPQQAEDRRLPRPRRARLRVRAAECVIDEIAEALDRDPLELRMQNSAKEGTSRADGFTYGPVGHEECLQAAQSSPHYQSELSGENRGRGVASGFWFNIGFETSMAAQVPGRRHRAVGHGRRRHRRQPRLRRDAAGRSAGHRRRGRQAAHRRHRLGRLHLPHRRQPHRLRQRLGRLRVRHGHPAPARGARRDDLGLRPART